MTFDPVRLHVLAAADVARLHALLTVFGAAFDDRATYDDARPDDAYLADLLASPDFIAIVAERDDAVIGGLAAYVLRKFERARSEIYIYDLAVDARHRRRGVATALIRTLQRIAAERGAYVIFVQADHGDDAAIRLYASLGRREDVLHFDIEPDPAG